MKKVIFFIVAVFVMCSCDKTMPQTTENGWERIAKTKYYVNVDKYDGNIWLGFWSDLNEDVIVKTANGEGLLELLKYLKPTFDKYRNISAENNIKSYSECIMKAHTSEDFYFWDVTYSRENYEDFIYLENYASLQKYGEIHGFSYNEFNEIIKALENSKGVANLVKVEKEKRSQEKERIKALYK